MLAAGVIHNESKTDRDFLGILSVLLTYYEAHTGSTLVSLVLVILIAATAGFVVS